jgi:hypothetical protein
LDLNGTLKKEVGWVNVYGICFLVLFEKNWDGLVFGYRICYSANFYIKNNLLTSTPPAHYLPIWPSPKLPSPA